MDPANSSKSKLTGTFLFILLVCLNTAHAQSNVIETQMQAAFAHVTSLKFVASVPLQNQQFPLFHPQGVKVIGHDVYVSTVEGRSKGFGHVIKFSLDSNVNPRKASPVTQLTFDPGPNQNLNHAGGLDFDGTALIVPLAIYNSNGPGQLLRLDLNNFGAYSVISKIDDHLGTVVSDDGAYFAMNWDSVKIYAIDKSNAHSTHVLSGNDWNYQDCKHLTSGYAVCSALQGKIFPSGEIQLVHFDTGPSARIEIVQAIHVENYHGDGSIGGWRPLTYNAMDLQPVLSADQSRLVGLRFFFVPHDDDEAHLLIFDAEI